MNAIMTKVKEDAYRETFSKISEDVAALVWDRSRSGIWFRIVSHVGQQSSNHIWEDIDER